MARTVTFLARKVDGPLSYCTVDVTYVSEGLQLLHDLHCQVRCCGIGDLPAQLYCPPLPRVYLTAAPTLVKRSRGLEPRYLARH